MDYVIAKEFLAFALNNINLIDAAVARILLEWRKELLIKEVVQLMSAAGLEFDADAMSNLRNCDSILKLKESIKEIFSNNIIKLFKVTPSIQFMSDLETSLEDYLKKHKEHLVSQLLKLLADNNITPRVDGAKLQLKDLKLVANRLLVMFDYTIDKIAKEVVSEHKFAPVIVNLAENYSMIPMATEVIVFCNKSVATVEEGTKQFLAIVKATEKDVEKLISPQLLEFKLGAMVASVYSVVEQPVHIEGYAGGVIMQNRNAELFILRAENKNNQQAEADELKSRPEILFPVDYDADKDKYKLSDAPAIVLEHPLEKIENIYVQYVAQPVIEAHDKPHIIAATFDKDSKFLEVVRDDLAPVLEQQIVKAYIVKNKKIAHAEVLSDKEKKIRKRIKAVANNLFTKESVPIQIQVQAVNDKLVSDIIHETKRPVKKVSFMEPVLEITIPTEQPEDAITFSRRASVRGKRVQEMVDMFEQLAEEKKIEAEPINELTKLQRTRSERSMSGLSISFKDSDPKSPK